VQNSTAVFQLNISNKNQLFCSETRPNAKPENGRLSNTHPLTIQLIPNFSVEMAVFLLKIGIFIYEIYPRKTPKPMGDVLPG